MPVCEYRDLFSTCGKPATRVVRHEMQWGGDQHLCNEHQAALHQHITAAKGA